MPRFIHLSAEASAKRIAHNGISPCRIPRHPSDLLCEDPDRLVWAFPLLPNFTTSYQWLRELKRRGAKTIVAVIFKIDDLEPVFARHFGAEPRKMTAAEAASFIRQLENPLGFEIMIPRRTHPSEIERVWTPPQHIGWRLNPKRSMIMLCACPRCSPHGRPKSKRHRIRARVLNG
jgi:hypothetical protein